MTPCIQSPRTSPPLRYRSFSGRSFLTTMGSSDFSHRFARSSDLSLSLAYLSDDARPPQLLCGLPVGNAILKHVMQLTRYVISRYFARSSPHAAESGSLSLCTAYLLLLPSDPTVAGSALAIRILFPLVGAMPASFSRPGLPASRGKQKGRLFRKRAARHTKGGSGTSGQWIDRYPKIRRIN